MIRTEYNITPVTKPRMTRRDKWNPSPAARKYFNFREAVQWLKVQLPVQGASVTFVMPMPKSWNDKKWDKMLGKPHKQTPDISNLLKALEDAVYNDDSEIWHYKTLQKIWGYEGKIIIETED